jgi:hypothetical protein
VFAPQRLGQPLDAQRVARPCRERGQDDAVARSDTAFPAGPAPDCERAEQTDAHTTNVDRGMRPVNATDTGLIPLWNQAGTVGAHTCHRQELVREP